MTTGNSEFEPEYVGRCTDAVENIGRKYMVGIIFISMVFTSLTMSELQSRPSQDASMTAQSVEVYGPKPVNADAKTLLNPVSAVFCKSETGVKYTNI